jgi:hypothetical protein
MDGSVRDGIAHCGPSDAGAAIIESIARWYILFQVSQPHVGGSSSVAERQLPKIDNPIIFNHLQKRKQA